MSYEVVIDLSDVEHRSFDFRRMFDESIPCKERIVRCRYCSHYSEHEWIVATEIDDVCHFWHGEPTKVSPDGFCAWGELRGDA